MAQPEVKTRVVQPQPTGPVPEETARVARAAFPKGNTCTRVRDEFGGVWNDKDFTGLFPKRSMASAERGQEK